MSQGIRLYVYYLTVPMFSASFYYVPVSIGLMRAYTLGYCGVRAFILYG